MPIQCLTWKVMPSVLMPGQLSTPVLGQYVKLSRADWMYSEGCQRARKSLRWDLCFADSILLMTKMMNDVGLCMLHCKQQTMLRISETLSFIARPQTWKPIAPEQQKSTHPQRMTKFMCGFRCCGSALISTLNRTALSGCLQLHLP